MIDTLIKDRRVVELRIAGQEMLAVAEDVPRLRDGLGFRSRPVWRPRSPRLLSIRSMILSALGPHPRPVRRLRIAQRYGLGRAIVESACDGLVAPGTLVAGSFVDCRARPRANGVSTATVKCWR